MSETLSAVVSSTRRTSRRPALYVGLAGDAPRTPPARFALPDVDRIDLGRGPSRGLTRRREHDLEVATISIDDTRASSQHARITRVGSQWVLEDLKAKNGTWVRGEAITRQALADRDVIVIGHTALVFRDDGGDDLPPARVPGITTLSTELDRELARLESAAGTRMPIEISGATGTGKELIARGAHTLSRRAGAFVAINCGALPAQLLESELFGHRKGAFTGATEDRAGLFRAAEGGTLFLDEIAELPLSSQAALLRVLQEGEVTPLGADRAIAVDVRVVTATHKDLDAEVAADRFRADLRARLLGVSVRLSPLCERPEDIGPLVTAFLDRHGARSDISFSSDVVISLYQHGWPLNVRELERTIGAAVGVAGGRIELEHLPKQLAAPPGGGVALASLSAADRELRESLTVAMREHDGNVAAIARALGKDPTQIRRWLKRLGLERR